MKKSNAPGSAVPLVIQILVVVKGKTTGIKTTILSIHRLHIKKEEEKSVSHYLNVSPECTCFTRVHALVNSALNKPKQNKFEDVLVKMTWKKMTN